MTVHAESHHAHMGLYQTYDRILNLRVGCYFTRCVPEPVFSR